MRPDQTPTPTRFLQNCEEVGLFKEIEEEFLQAQEEEKSKQVNLKNMNSFEIKSMNQDTSWVLLRGVFLSGERSEWHLNVMEIKAVRSNQTAADIRPAARKDTPSDHVLPVN